MKKRTFKTATLWVAALFGVAITLFAQEKKGDSPSADSAVAKAVAAAVEPATTTQSESGKQPSAEEMQKEMAQMMELSKIGENHKRLADLSGTWNYTVKIMIDPATGKPQESKGTATRKAIMDGRFFLAEHSGKFQFPGPDGKMKDMNFKGMAIEGYDNVKKKYVVSWIDNMGTMILSSEGDYDEANKTFTYTADCEVLPGKTMKIREVIKVADKDHHNFEWYEDRGAGETKTMEIAYTRKK